MVIEKRGFSPGTLRIHTPRQDIQGMRGLAVLIVVAYHAGLPLPGGFVGVDIFFVISGFVITGLLVRELDHRQSINFSRFYGRRVRRLLPALTLVVLTTIFVSFLLGSPFDQQQEVTALTGIGALLMVANAVVFLNSGQYFAVPPTNNPLLNTWSLSVEEQFYLVFPASLFILWLIGTKIRKRFEDSNQTQRLVIITGLIVITLTSFLLSVGMTYGTINWRLTDPDWFAFYSSPTRAWEFAVGALVFLLFGYQAKRERPGLGALLVISGTVGMLVAAFVINESFAFPGFIAGLPVLAAAAALAGGSLSHSWTHTFLAVKPLARLGDLSYSWYLWHWPLIAFALLVFGESLPITISAAVLALLLSVITLRYLENPIRFRTRLGSTRAKTIALSCVTVVVVAGLVLFFGARGNWWNTQLASLNQQVSAVHLWQSIGCDTPTPLGKRGPECTWNSDANGSPIYLVGDSMAGMLSEAALEAGKNMGSPVLPGTLGACPFIDAALILEGRVETECVSFVEHSLKWLTQEAKPGRLILSSSFGYITMGGAQLQTKLSSKPAATTLEKTTAYLTALDQTVRPLASAGHEVHVILPTPGFPQTLNASWFWYPSQCSTVEALTAIKTCGMERRIQDVAQETAVLEDQIRQTVTAAGGRTVQLRDFLCTNALCATNDGNDWIYLDGTHITVDASRTLGTEFIRQLQK